jgi:hypothetical protein
MERLKSSKPSDQGIDRQKEGTVEVLYQKLGARWFAFSCIDDEVFVGSLDPEKLPASDAVPQGSQSDS